MGRYISDPIINSQRFGTSEAIDQIRNAAARGEIPTSTLVMTDGHRLDTLAGLLLGNAKLWWIIAALSGIGWGLQVPAGTRILMPTSLEQIAELVE